MGDWEKYLARSSKDRGFETCVQHLVMTGCLDSAFTCRLGKGDYDEEAAREGMCAGLLHDVGKYSDEFQTMIRQTDDEQ